MFGDWQVLLAEYSGEVGLTEGHGAEEWGVSHARAFWAEGPVNVEMLRAEHADMVWNWKEARVAGAESDRRGVHRGSVGL